MGRRSDEAGEKRGVTASLLGVPLHGDEKLPVGRLDRLDRSVGTAPYDP